MEKIPFECEGRKAVLYRGGQAELPLIVLNEFDGDGEPVLRALEEIHAPACHLLVVQVPDWNGDMSPWPCPPVMGKEPPYTGGADACLEQLTGSILPEALSRIPGEPSFIGVAGYSLAGLFALYSLYRCDVFSRAASISGSLWFPDFLEYAETQEMKRRSERLYLSLGDREDRSRNPILRTVRDHTEQLASHLEQKGLRVTWELNPGNHFMEPELRTAKGIRALLEA